jgi:DNA-binding phage protein
LVEARVQAIGGRLLGAADLINTPETAAAIFKLAVAANDSEFLLRSLRVLSHSKGMSDALAWSGMPGDLPRRAIEAEGPTRAQALTEVTRCLTARLDAPAAMVD